MSVLVPGTKITLDTQRILYAELNMGLFHEAAPRVERAAFMKGRTNALIARKPFICPVSVQGFKHCAVQIPFDMVRIAYVARHILWKLNWVVHGCEKNLVGAA